MLKERTEQGNKQNFIVFEGIDGSGKTTQILLLMEKLRAMGIDCFETKEPTGGPIGSVIRQVLTGRIKMDYKALAGLYAADRLDHLLNQTDGIYNLVKNGTTVICDRYYFSSYAYHGVDVPMDWVIEMNSLSAETLRPVCHIFIDVDPEEAIQRIEANRSHMELFEKLEKLIQVRQKYFEAFSKLKDVEQIFIINGNQPQDKIAEEIWGRLAPLFI